MALNYPPLRRLRPPPSPTNRRLLSKKPRRKTPSTPIARTDPKGFLPTFPPTSSAELDAALRAFKTHVLEPGVLTGAQKKLLRDPSQRAYLESEEVTARFGDATVRLLPWDSKLAASSEEGLRPRTHALFRDALRLSTSPADLAAVWPDLLASLRASRHAKLREAWFAEWLAHARRHGAAGAIVAVLRERSRIGVPLAGEEGAGNARTARFAICEFARADVADRARLEEALGWAEKVNGLVESDAAKSSWLERRGPRDVLSFAVPMEVAALLSVIVSRGPAETESEAENGEASAGEPSESQIKRFETYGETTVKYLHRLLDVLKSNDPAVWNHRASIKSAVAGEGDKTDVSRALVAYAQRLEELILVRGSLRAALRCPDVALASLETRANESIATLSQELDDHLAFVASDEFSAFLKKTYPSIEDARYQRYQKLLGAE